MMNKQLFNTFGVVSFIKPFNYKHSIPPGFMNILKNNQHETRYGLNICRIKKEQSKTPLEFNVFDNALLK